MKEKLDILEIAKDLNAFVVLDDDAIKKITILNLTNNNFEDKLSKHIALQKYFEKPDLFSCDENKILDTNLLCIVYNEADDLIKKKLRVLLIMREKNQSIYFV